MKHDAAYFARSVLTPAAECVTGYSLTMPPFALSEMELRALEAYVRSADN